MAAKISQNSTKYQPSTRFFHVRCLFPCNLGHWIHFRWQKLFSPNGYIDGGHIFKMAAKISQNQPSTRFFHVRCHFPCTLGRWIHFRRQKLFSPNGYKDGDHILKMVAKISINSTKTNRPLDSFIWDVFFHVIWAAEFISGDKNYFRPIFQRCRPYVTSEGSNKGVSSRSRLYVTMASV